MFAFFFIFLVCYCCLCYCVKAYYDADRHPIPTLPRPTLPRPAIPRPAVPRPAVPRPDERNSDEDIVIGEYYRSIYICPRCGSIYLCPHCWDFLIASSSRDPFHNFVQELISKFKSQSQNKQFAVLYLSPANELEEIKPQFSTLNDGPLTDAGKTIWPLQRNQDNFLVARVSRRHAEVSLCSRAFSLISDYQTRRGTSPGYIVIFSWLMPCKNCTDEIIRSFSSGNRVVVYVRKWTKKGKHVEDNPEENRRRLRENGFVIKKM